MTEWRKKVYEIAKASSFRELFIVLWNIFGGKNLQHAQLYHEL